MDLSPYRADMPYPAIENLKPSFYNVRCLTGDYAGFASETTAIFTYIYQSYIMRPQYPDTADMLEGIAITEMHHNEILGSCIVSMQGDPVFAARQGFWTARSVNYSKDPKIFLRNNIESEKRAVDDYYKTIRCVTEPLLAEIIERIIKDEEVHIKLFEEMLAKF